MLGDGFYDKDLITFPQAEKGNGLDVYCKLEGFDFQQLASENSVRRLLTLFRNKPVKIRPEYTSAKH